MFIRNGKGDSSLSQTGALASGVPGSLAVYEFAVSHFGQSRLGDLLLPAADLAERGFKIDGRFAHNIASEAREIARFPATQQGALHVTTVNRIRPATSSGSLILPARIARSQKREPAGSTRAPFRYGD